jgi:hypothetical protein
MRELTRFLDLSAQRRSLFLQTGMVVGAIRIGLWVLPFATVQRLVLRAGQKVTASHPVEQIIWAVTSVSRRIPGSTCLTQALAAQALLGRSGHHATIQIGVAKDEESRFEAHAWLLFDGCVILGGEVNRFTSIMAVEAKR